MSQIIFTKNINRTFEVGKEKIYALKNVNIQIEVGKLTVLIGRSGSGKTTLVNLLGALDFPDSGNILYDGKDLTKLGDSERTDLRCKHMGFIFQSTVLVSYMTVYENVEFALRLSGYEKKKMIERVENCLTLVGLSKKMLQFPGELSGGEQQRVAIARAISYHPSIIFADEPTSDLDTHTGLQIMKIFKELIRNEGVSIIMTTHDENMIEIADDVIELVDGEVVKA